MRLVEYWDWLGLDRHRLDLQLIWVWIVLFLQFPNLPGKHFPHFLPNWAHLHPEHDPLRLHLQQDMSQKEQLKLIQSPRPTD